MSSQYAELLGILTAEIGWRVWATQQISTGFASCLRYCIDVAQRRSTKLRTMFGRLLGWYTIIHFRGLLPRNGILTGAILTLRPNLAFSYRPIGNVTARHSSSGRQPNFAAWYREWTCGTFDPRHFRSRERKPPNEIHGKWNKCSAVAEMLDRLVSTDTGRK